MRACEFKKHKNEIQLLKTIWSLGFESVFNNIYREAGFLKSPSARKLSRSTLSSYLHGLQDKGLIKKVDKWWFLTEEGYKTLKIQKIILESVIVRNHDKSFLITRTSRSPKQ